ncbi:MAG: hypothetical protein IJB33_08360 [Akkermansia sp.]|nr:hypothetical protein [Akkermansia sp.]
MKDWSSRGRIHSTTHHFSHEQHRYQLHCIFCTCSRLHSRSLAHPTLPPVAQPLSYEDAGQEYWHSYNALHQLWDRSNSGKLYADMRDFLLRAGIQPAD